MCILGAWKQPPRRQSAWKPPPATIFEIDFVENNLFGIIEIKAEVGLTDLDCFLVCTPDTAWEVK